MNASQLRLTPIANEPWLAELLALLTDLSGWPIHVVG